MRTLERRLRAVALTLTNLEPGGSATLRCVSDATSDRGRGTSGSAVPSAASSVSANKPVSDQLDGGGGLESRLGDLPRFGDLDLAMALVEEPPTRNGALGRSRKHVQHTGTVRSMKQPRSVVTASTAVPTRDTRGQPPSLVSCAGSDCRCALLRAPRWAR